MDVVGVFVPADRVHIRVESLAVLEAVALQSVAFPLCKGMDDLRGSVALFLDAEGDWALHAVQVVVQAGLGQNEQGGGHAQKVQAFCESLLKEILDCLDGNLGIVEIQFRSVVFRYRDISHNNVPPLSIMDGKNR